MATPRDNIVIELKAALFAMERAIVGWNFDAAKDAHDQIEALLDRALDAGIWR